MWPWHAGQTKQITGCADAEIGIDRRRQVQRPGTPTTVKLVLDGDLIERGLRRVAAQGIGPAYTWRDLDFHMRPALKAGNGAPSLRARRQQSIEGVSAW